MNVLVNGVEDVNRDIGGSLHVFIYVGRCWKTLV